MGRDFEIYPWIIGGYLCDITGDEYGFGYELFG